MFCLVMCPKSNSRVLIIEDADLSVCFKKTVSSVGVFFPTDLKEIILILQGCVRYV